MPTPDEFRQRLQEVDADTVVDEYLLVGGAKHVTDVGFEYIRGKLAEAFAIPVAQQDLKIVGSAKLGFSISEKTLKEGGVLARYRPFRAESDIDVAVINSGIFNKIWFELAEHSHRQAYFPWNSQKLGDYFICGWIRPDLFPKNVRLRYCDCWWDCFREMSAGGRLGRRRVRGGLFQSPDCLRLYLRRAVQSCVEAEEIQR